MDFHGRYAMPYCRIHIILRVFNGFNTFALNDRMQLVITGDGSHTLYVPELDEHYHSSFGALTESVHVFRKAGLDLFLKQNQIIVFEVGFGTGLNALLAFLVAIDVPVDIHYYALEKEPVDQSIISKLNYPERISSRHPVNDLFMAIHEALWEERVTLHPNFKLFKMRADLTSFNPDFYYDLIFFDAFAPEKQPEMWTPEIFRKLYSNLRQGGVLTTYCVKGSVKRMLRETGFVLEKLPGPPGKREILRGRKG